MKPPDPNCQYCHGVGLVQGRVQGNPALWINAILPCICTNEYESDEPTTDRERVV